MCDNVFVPLGANPPGNGGGVYEVTQDSTEMRWETAIDSILIKGPLESWKTEIDEE